MRVRNVKANYLKLIFLQSTLQAQAHQMYFLITFSGGKHLINNALHVVVVGALP